MRSCSFRDAVTFAITCAITFAVTSLAPVRAQSNGKLEKVDLTIGVGGSAADVDKLGYGFALAKGFFKEEGLNVTNIDFNSGTRAAQAIVGGTVDATDSAYEHALRLQAQGLTFKCLVTFARYPGVAMVAVKGRNVHTLADLKGKIIGVTAPGSLTQTLAVALLNSVGLKKEDASFVGVGVGPSALAAVQSGGQIDALVNVDPTITALLKSGAATMLVDARIEKGSKQAFGGPYPNGCMLASDDFIKKYPNTTQAIANAIVHSMKYLQTASIDDIVKSVPRSYFQDEKIYREALKTDLEMIRWDGLLSPEIGRTVLNGIALLDDKFKNANIDISKTYTNEFTLRALEKFKNFKP